MLVTQELEISVLIPDFTVRVGWSEELTQEFPTPTLYCTHSRICYMQSITFCVVMISYCVNYIFNTVSSTIVLPHNHHENCCFICPLENMQTLVKVFRKLLEFRKLSDESSSRVSRVNAAGKWKLLAVYLRCVYRNCHHISGNWFLAIITALFQSEGTTRRNLQDMLRKSMERRILVGHKQAKYLQKLKVTYRLGLSMFI